MRYGTTSAYIRVGTCAIVLEAFSAPAYIVYITDEFEIPAANVAAATFVYAMAYALFAPIIAYTARDCNQEKLSSASLLFFFVATIGAASSNDINQYILFKFLAAISAAAFTPVAYSVASRLGKPDSGVSGLASLSLAVSTSTVISVPLSLYLSETLSWRIAAVFYGSLALLAYAMKFTFKEDMYDYFRDEYSFRCTPIENSQIFLYVSYFVPSLCWTAASYTIYNYIPYVFGSHLTPSELSFLMITYGLGGVTGTLSRTAILHSVSGPSFLLSSLLLSAVSVLSVFALRDSPFIYAPLFVMGFLSWSAFIANQEMLVSRVRLQTTITLSLNNSLLYVGAAIGSMVGGLLVGVDGTGRLNTLVSASIYILSFVLSAAIFLRKRAK